MGAEVVMIRKIRYKIRGRAEKSYWVKYLKKPDKDGNKSIEVPVEQVQKMR